MSALEAFTIGHSNHSWERFLQLVRGAGVTAIADVRSSPFSRYMNRFSQDVLKPKLDPEGIAYVFLGKELGGRPADPRHYRDGVVDYERMAQSPLFQSGIRRVIQGMQRYRVALMCAEQDPLDCHRCLLVGRVLAKEGVRMRHILADGQMPDQGEIEKRLLELTGLDGGDLFTPQEELMAEAYRARARKVAFTRDS